jgi:hypothetical protein
MSDEAVVSLIRQFQAVLVKKGPGKIVGITGADLFQT